MNLNGCLGGYKDVIALNNVDTRHRLVFEEDWLIITIDMPIVIDSAQKQSTRSVKGYCFQSTVKGLFFK